jgi:hypothetical protein
VIDLGNVLRVPRRALEELIGAELSDVPDGHHPASEADPRRRSRRLPDLVEPREHDTA